MAIYDYDGTSTHEIGKLYDYDGTSSFQIGKVYDYDGTSTHLIYSAEETHSLSVTVTQKEAYNDDMNWASSDYVVNGFTKVKNITVNCGTSYGRCRTQIRIWRNNSPIVALIDQTRDYTGSGFTGNATVTYGEWSGLQNGDVIALHIGANYNHNVSGQRQSSSSCTFTVE